jgi:hypothetical protein
VVKKLVVVALIPKKLVVVALSAKKTVVDAKVEDAKVDAR